MATPLRLERPDDVHPNEKEVEETNNGGGGGGGPSAFPLARVASRHGPFTACMGHDVEGLCVTIHSFMGVTAPWRMRDLPRACRAPFGRSSRTFLFFSFHSFTAKEKKEEEEECGSDFVGAAGETKEKERRREDICGAAENKEGICGGRYMEGDAR